MSLKQIVWLASYPKSGNTWVRLFLDAYYLGELDLNKLVTSVSDDNAARHTIGSDWDPRDLPIDAQMLTRPMSLLRLVLAYNKDKLPGLPLFVKTHNAHMITNGIELLPECLTQATICIVRDPRDVVISFAKHMGESIDDAIGSLLDKYRVLEAKDSLKMADFLSSWPMSVDSYTGADSHNVMVIRYEDMRERPLESFRHILKHAGVEPDNDRIQKALDLCEISKLQKLEKENGFLESSPKNKDGFFSGGGRVRAWEDKLTHYQRRKIERACEKEMRQLGYLEGKGKGKKVYPH